MTKIFAHIAARHTVHHIDYFLLVCHECRISPNRIHRRIHHEFRRRIAAGDFLEYEEVYRDRFYGTLRSEVERIRERGETVVFDVDVVGGCNIREQYAGEALSIFVRPPSVEALRERLVTRATDAPEVIEDRLRKAEYELTFAPRFDVVILNDDLETAQREVVRVVREFIEG